MQTNFSAQQLAKPQIAEADSILRSCVHCGLCTATCPTYVLLGDERDSPRGRIYLIKDMLEQARPASTEVTRHVDRCLSCLSCMTTCPSGVDYMHLVDIARAHIRDTAPRSPAERLMRRFIARTVPQPDRFRLAMLAGKLAKPFSGLMRGLGMKRLAAMTELVPKGLPRRGAYRFPGVFGVQATRKRRVILSAGCAQQVLRPDINDATIRLLNRSGIDVVVPPRAGCCGALTLHMGEAGEAEAMARTNIEAWEQAIDEAPVEAILINTSGCGTTIKDYGHLMRRDGRFVARAGRIAAISKDVTEYLIGQDLGAPKRWSSLRVAYHSACSLQHGQQVRDEPASLLRKAGFALTEIAEGHICCGSAGTYNMLQPELSAELRARKIGHIEQARPDVVATGNIGCITQLQKGTAIPVVHTIELLDWAYGGPCPRGLGHFEMRMSDVPPTGMDGIALAGALARRR